MDYSTANPVKAASPGSTEAFSKVVVDPISWSEVLDGAPGAQPEL